MLEWIYNEDTPDLRQVGINPNYWYPLTQAKRLKRGKTVAVSFAGNALVLARTERGNVFALEDRCAHRQVPLSRGVMRGESLQCYYHSWRYDGSGRCLSIPYLPKGEPRPYGVRSYPCRDAYGHIFVFPGEANLADQVPFPILPTWGSLRHKTMYFSRHVNCHYSFMHENLMDMNHQFLHRRLMGDINATAIDTRRGDDWLEVDYRFESTGGTPHFGARFMVRDKAEDPSARRYDIMTIKTKYPYQTLRVRPPESTEPAFDLWTAYVPVDGEQRINHSFGLLMIRKPSIPGLIYLLWPFMRYFTQAIFRQDRQAVEAEQRAHDLQGGDWNHEVFPLIRELKGLLTRCGVPLKPGRTVNAQSKTAA